MIVPDNIGIVHDQAAFPVAQPLAVALGKVDQGVGLLLRGGPRHERLVVDKPVQPVPDGRGLHLPGLPLLLKLGKVAVDLGNQVVGRGPDGFKGGFQLGQLLAGTPTGHIAERVVRRVQPVVLADGVGHALGLHLAGAAVGAVGQFLRRGVLVNGVEGGVGDLMDGGFQGLQFAHALVDGDALFLQVVVAVRPALDVLKGDGDGGSPLQGGEEVLIPLHAAGQLVHGDVGYLPALGLGHVEHRHHLKGGDGHFLFLGQRLPVRAGDGPAAGVQLFHLPPHLVGGRGQNLDGPLPPLHMALELVLPLVVARHQGGVRLLHGDQEGVVEAVIVELGHGGEVVFILFALKKGLNTGFQPVGDLFHALGVVPAGQHNGNDGLGGRGGLLRLPLGAAGLVPLHLRGRKGQHPVFLRDDLALIDLPPLVAAFDDIAVFGKGPLFQPGDVLSQRGRVDGGFPLVRHIHHPGTVQVVVPQRRHGMDVGEIDVVIQIVRVVNDAADRPQFGVLLLQGGVQCADLVGVQLFQPGGKEIQLVHAGGQRQVVGDSQVSALRGGKAADEIVPGIILRDADLPHRRLHLFRRGGQVQPDAGFAVPLGGVVAQLYGKYFAHSVAPFCSKDVPPPCRTGEMMYLSDYFFQSMRKLTYLPPVSARSTVPS